MHSVGMCRESLSWKNNNRGFSLLEVLVALTVAAIALTVLVQGLTRYANQFVYLRESTIARSIGGGYLTRRILEPEYIPPEFVENAGTTWELRFDEEPYYFRDLENLKRINLMVYDNNERHVVTLQAIVRDPDKNQ